MKNCVNKFAFLILLNVFSSASVYSMSPLDPMDICYSSDIDYGFIGPKAKVTLRNGTIISKTVAEYIVAGIKYLYETRNLNKHNQDAWHSLIKVYVNNVDSDHYSFCHVFLKDLGLCCHFILKKYVQDIIDCTIVEQQASNGNIYYEFRECLLYAPEQNLISTSLSNGN